MRPKPVRPLLLFVLSLSMVSASFAQNCGQRDTIVFLNNTAGSIDLTISDYFNDDLSDPMQGLCGIEIGFVHQFVENLEVSITSPAGQTVDLIGPNGNDALDFTLGTQWDISFVPCLETAQPDSAFAAQWDNEQPENWVNFGNYTGSYYPFQGCLEDFDTGPVNGVWTFDINNNPSNNPGAITYLRLIFCDSRGVECCFAQAGQWVNEDMLSCLGSDTLLIDPQISFPNGLADTLEYDYAFLIHRDGIYQRLDSVIDLRSAEPGIYDICGFSYRGSQLDSLPLPDGILTLDSIRNNLTGLEPWLCAELTPECLRVQIVAPPDTTRLEERICTGDSIVVGTLSFFDGGFYTVDLNNEAGCDSIVILDLFVQDLQETFLTEIICPGDSFVVGTTAYFETGIYLDTLPTVELGCDSIVQLDLTMLSDILVELDSIICLGDQIQVGDSILQDAGSYQILLESYRGCDSLVQIDLTVLDPQAQITGVQTLNCQTTSIILDGENMGGPGTFSYRWLDDNNMELGQNPTQLIDQAGNYFLGLTQTFSGVSCQDRDTVFVDSNFNFPIADAGADTAITCRNEIIDIGGTMTSTGINYVYEWQATNGLLIPPTNQPTLSINTADEYQLIVQDTVSFCADTASVNVLDQTSLPAVIIADGFTLNCQLLQGTLDGSASLINSTFTANWSGPCINTTLAPAIVTVDCPGWYILEVENTSTGCINRDSILIEENIEPAVAAIAPLSDILNCNVLQVELNAGSSNPAGLLTYEWEGPGMPPANQAQVLVNEAGNYQLIVTRTDNFCRDTAMILVTQDTLAPVADAGPDLELNCNLADAYTQGSNSSSGSTISYQWFSNSSLLIGETNDSLLVTTSGTYILEVTNNENGCSDLDTVNITEDFLPPELVQAGPNSPLNCAGEIVFLTPDSTGFSRPVDWTWDGPCFTTPTDTWTVATDCAGLYTLTVTNQGNGCSAFDTVRVTASNNFSQAILADDVLSLDCDTGTATLNTTGSIGSIFQWFRDDVAITLPNNNPNINQAGMYILVASDANMICSDTARTEIIIDCPLVAVIAPPDTINCRQNLISLNADGSTTNGEVTYQWTGPGAGCFVDDPQQSTVTVVCPGSYQLILEQTLFGLRDTTLVEVLIDTVAPVVNAGENLQVTCAVPVPTLTGSVVGNPDDYSFTWTDFSGTDTLSFTSELSTDLPGSYFFVAENIRNGCSSRDIAQITFNNIEIDIAFGSSVFPCLTDTFRLEAFVSPTDTNYIYQWSGPGIVSDADSLDALINTIGAYFLTVENPLNGCSTTDTIMVTDQICAPCLNLSATDTLNCLSDDLLLSASFCASCNGCTLQWSDEDGPISGANNLDLTVNTAGQYTLMATDLLGFSSSASVEVFDLTTPPLLTLGPDRILTCDSNSFILQNQQFNASSSLRYEWSLLDGTIINNSDSTLVVDQENTYVLTLTDTLSLCAIADTINLAIDIENPIAEAGPDQLLTCESNIVVLDGSASTLANATYTWTGPTAACLAGAQTTTPIASCAGLYFLQVTLNRNGCTAQDSVSVTRNEVLPGIIPIPDTLINCLQPTVVLEGNSPNTEGYSLLWCALDGMGNAIPSSCDTFLNYMVNAGGDYQFTLVNDTTLCSSSYTVSVAVDSLPPFVDAGQMDTLRCGTTTLMLNGNSDSATSISWSGPAGASIVPVNSLSPTIDMAGWYYLSATSNGNGCSATDSVLVVVDENIPTLDAGPDTLLNCNNVTIQLNATGNTNSGSNEWQWITQTGTIVGAANTPSLTVADSAWYFVSLTDPVNSCSVTDSVFVSLDNSPPMAMVSGIDTITCTQDTLLLDAINSVSSSGQGVTYNWHVINGQLFPDLGAEQVFTDRPGTYQLVVEDLGNGCTDTLSFDIESNKTPPELSLAIPDSLACNVDSVLLQPTIPTSELGFNFEWSNVDGTLISENYTANASAPGRYYLLIEDEDNGCTSLDSVDVFSRDDFPVVNIASPLPLTCLRLVVTLDASASSEGANFEYQWSSLSGGSLLGTTSSLVDSTAMAGTYQLIITDTNTGCQRQDSVQVISTANPIVGTDLEITPPPCDGGSTGQEQGSISVNGVMGGTPPYLYRLNNEPFESISFFEDLPVGPYLLRIRDSGGCIWEESATLQLPIGIILDLGPDLEIELGDSVQLIPQFSQVIDSFYWESFGLFPPTATLRPNISPQETQFIVLTVIDENDCIDSDTLRVFVADDLDIFVPTAFSPNGDGENDVFTVYGGPEVARVRRLRVFSRWGNMVYEKINFLPNDPNQGWDGTLWGEPLNPGVFVYQLEVSIGGRGVRFVTGEVVLLR